MRLRFITGLEGPTLTPDERRFLADAEPAGLILFARNIETPEQVRRLIGEACDAVGHNDTLVLVDQEGGRVQRFAPPEWRRMPHGASYLKATGGDVAQAAEHARLVAHQVAADLKPLGVNVICAPVLDVPVEGAHPIIGARAYADDAEGVAAIARGIADGLIAGGVAPVGKHVPGHGRADVDTHDALPVVNAERDALTSQDFAAFKALADLPAFMTAHVVFDAIDATEPASTSARMHADIIRGEIGFAGLLMSDDLSMKALDGPIGRRTERVLQAGSDLALHCNGELGEMEAVAAAAMLLEGHARDRLEACFAATQQAGPLDEEAAEDARLAVIAFEDARHAA
ncbi:MAG: beta-N-acetylhexosaminidase [Pseudomonadota bacterium]